VTTGNEVCIGIGRRQKWKKDITIQEIEHRLAALEKTVASLTAEKNSDKPRGRFAHIGGIERIPAHSPEGSQRIDFSEAYGSTGKRVL